MEWSSRWEKLKKTVIRFLEFNKEIVHSWVYTGLYLKNLLRQTVAKRSFQKCKYASISFNFSNSGVSMTFNNTTCRQKRDVLWSELDCSVVVGGSTHDEDKTRVMMIVSWSRNIAAATAEDRRPFDHDCAALRDWSRVPSRFPPVMYGSTQPATKSTEIEFVVVVWSSFSFYVTKEDKT